MSPPESFRAVDASQGTGEAHTPSNSCSAFPFEFLTQNIVGEDPFSSFSTSSSFTLPMGSNLTPDVVNDQTYCAGGATLKQQSMDSLRIYSAALHSAMGFGPLADDTFVPGRSKIGDLMPHTGAQFDGTDASLATNSALAFSGAPSTPGGAARGRTLDHVMFTDEISRFTDFEQFEVAMPEGTPTRPASRRIFTLTQEDIGDLGN